MPNQPIPTLHDLELTRERLKEQIAQIGDMRLGTLSESYRKCGKPTCHCAREGDPKHGPFYLLYRRGKEQKAIGRSIPPKYIEITQEQVAECHRFRELCQEYMEVNEQICDIKLRNPGLSDESVKKNTRKQPGS